MGFRIMARRSGNGPVQSAPRLTCDRCNKLIDDAWDAWYMWDITAYLKSSRRR
jgi:hypothetical protein